jgi:hypothetical protein
MVSRGNNIKSTETPATPPAFFKRLEGKEKKIKVTIK